MPITYKKGNWFGLPELGVSEFFGGNKNSTFNPVVNKKVDKSNDMTMTPSSLTQLRAVSSNTYKTDPSPPLGGGPSPAPRTPTGGGGKRNEPIPPFYEDPEDDYSNLKKQIANEYDSMMGNYDMMVGNLNAQLPLTEQGITQSYESQLPGVQKAQGDAVAGLQGQQATAEAETGGVLNQARRLYNELSSGASKYGGSAQEAYGELLGRSTAEAMGTAQNNLTQIKTQIQGEMGRVKDYYNAKLIELEKSKNFAIEQARADFRAEINKVNSQRAQAGVWKTNQNLEALRQFKEKANEIKKADYIYKQALDAWQQESTKTLADTYQTATYKLNYTDLNTIASQVADQTGKPLTMDQLQGLYRLNGYNPNEVDWESYLRQIGVDTDNLQAGGESAVAQEQKNWWEE